MEQTLRVVGKRLPNKENFDKVQGKAEYCATITLPGMLVGKLLHSPHAHARVLRVDASRAERLPGVKAVISKKDSPKKIFTWNVMTFQLPEGELQDMYLFDEVVRYPGEPVAAVAAINEEVARQALDLIEVDYEVLPAVFSLMRQQSLRRLWYTRICSKTSVFLPVRFLVTVMWKKTLPNRT